MRTARKYPNESIFPNILLQHTETSLVWLAFTSKPKLGWIGSILLFCLKDDEFELIGPDCELVKSLQLEQEKRAGKL